ncbi:MAG: CrcB family protein [Actinomycetota bacterium]
MRTIVAVGIAGFIGALARYGVEALITRGTGTAFPWGTLVVNVTGSFLLGWLFAALVKGRLNVAPWLKTGLTVGLVGTYTTFSAFSLETFRLIEDGSYGLAGLNAAGSLVLGLAAVSAGIVVGRSV